MRLRTVAIVAIASALGIAPLACVDLFHSTDFETAKPDVAVTPDVVTPDATRDAGPKPLVDFCKWSPTEAKDNAARSCAWLGACGGTLGETVFGPCMLHALWAYDCSLNPNLRPKGTTEALWSCLVDVKSCGEVEACLTGGAAPTCEPVAGGTFTTCGPPGSAASDTRVECGNAVTPLNLEPCAMQGRTCFILDNSASICAGATTKNCPQGLDCSGTAAVDCRSDGMKLLDYGIDCAAFGAGKCVVGDGGGVACAPSPTAPDCDAGIAVRCDPNFPSVAHSCVGGKDIAIQCSKLGVGCDITTKPIPAYDPLQACAERLDAGRCNSADDCSTGKLRSCAQGIAFEADCTALGLGACERPDGGVLARCSPP